MTTNPDTTLTLLALTQIKPGINPRTEFDPAKLNELAQSLKDDGGAVQPVVVYLDDDGLYGLIAGERRWKASGIAGLETIEAVVRPKPAKHEARKKALKENMQREDLTPLEIARAVHDMLAETNEYGAAIYSKTQLADELGKSPQYISACEALLRCTERLQTRVHLGKTPLEIAALIGSLPADMHDMAEQDIVMGPQPMSVHAARDHIAEKYRRDLRKAQFDQADAKLVEGKPACQQCEFWGGKRDDIQGKNRVHVCLNPACYDRKQQAYVTMTANASNNGHGVRMLSETERGKVFSFDGVTVKGDSGYVAADELPDKIMLVDPKATVPVWSKIVEGSEIPCEKIVDGDGRVRTLYDARLAVQVATAQTSAVKTLFKSGKATNGTATTATQTDTATDAAKEKAKATGLLASGRNWVSMIRDSGKGDVLREIVKLIYERLTEAVDREWMAKVLEVKNPLDYEDGKGSAEVLGLALIARTLRLQGPRAVQGIAGDLAKIIGYDGKKEAKDVDTLIAAAEKKCRKCGNPESVCACPPPGSQEQLYTCEKCGQANFTKRGLAAHNCEKRQKKTAELVPAKASPEVEKFAKKNGMVLMKPAKSRGGKREKNDKAEQIALKAYLDTGSIKDAATACGLDVESVKNWHKRRGWKALRAAHLSKKK